MEISVLSMIASAVLVLVCLYLVIAPFFKNESTEYQASIDISAHENKAALMTTLNEIEFEYKMSKISDEDYKKLKKQYELLIADLLKQEDKMVEQEMDQDVLKEVEAEIEMELLKRKEEQGRK
jgi:hypothetical protein